MGFADSPGLKCSLIPPLPHVLPPSQVSTASSSASNVDVAVVVPFPFLVPVKETLKGSNVLIGAQDL